MVLKNLAFFLPQEDLLSYQLRSCSIRKKTFFRTNQGLVPPKEDLLPYQLRSWSNHKKTFFPTD